HISEGRVFLASHYDFARFREVATRPPFVRNPAEQRLFQNPFLLSFISVFGLELLMHGKRVDRTGTKELIEILFDEGMDNRKRLALGYRRFVEVMRKGPEAHFVDLLVNKEAEFRDDKVFLPLQATDLLAWHVRRQMYEEGKGRPHNDPVWLKLSGDKRIHYARLLFGSTEFQELLNGMIRRFI